LGSGGVFAFFGQDYKSIGCLAYFLGYIAYFDFYFDEDRRDSGFTRHGWYLTWHGGRVIITEIRDAFPHPMGTRAYSSGREARPFFVTLRCMYLSMALAANEQIMPTTALSR
jgi:hypothetical protein